MKRIIIWILIFMGLISLTSCDNNDNNSVEKDIAKGISTIMADYKYNKDPRDLIVKNIKGLSVDKKVIIIETNYTNVYYVLEDFVFDWPLFELIFGDEKDNKRITMTIDEMADYFIKYGVAPQFESYYDYYKKYFGSNETFKKVYGISPIGLKFKKGMTQWSYDDTGAKKQLLDTLVAYSDTSYSLVKYDIGKINKYLKEYKEEMGWI